MEEPRYGAFTLSEAIDGLMAFDGGAIDSGIHDDEMRDWVSHQLFHVMTEDENRIYLTRLIRERLSDDSVAQGYGWEDIRSLIEWIDNL